MKKSFKSFLDYLPFVLLILVTLHSVIFTITISNALVVFALTLLSGLKYYFNHNSHPNYLELLKEDILKLQKINDSRLQEHINEVKHLKESYTKQVAGDLKVKRTNDFEF